ncbi:uncharacterized protein LOC114788979 isoform X2 [Denticeps clupeoides]|uniref:uncharacterized protein LOC114788979 isoform X2 n=1 Tax=Denticeps clupeoides TaxID=299321 RepID=UPI0010A3FC10|nr:uncharacterized protein LOC114788979 isoform X2 [Denticeps clupeoides]
MEEKTALARGHHPPSPKRLAKRAEASPQLSSDVDLLSGDPPEPMTPPPSSSSPCSSPPLSGSAVSALQSKVKALSHRRTVDREKDDLAPDIQLFPSQRREGDESRKGTSSDKEAVELQFEGNTFLTSSLSPGEPVAQVPVQGEPGKEGMLLCVARQPRGLGEGASLESLLSDGAVGLQEDTYDPNPCSSSTYSRHWAPPKGFWKAARPETLLLNGKSGSLPVLLKEEPPPVGEGCHRKPKLKIESGDVAVNKELHRSDSLESHLRHCWQKDEGPGGLWRADSWDSVCPRGGARSLAERVEMNRKVLHRHLVKDFDATTVYLDVPHLQEDDWRRAEVRGLLGDSETDLTMSPLEYEQIYSPRHEQAKRLLERARSKARSQASKDEQPAQPSLREVPINIQRQGKPGVKDNQIELHSGLPLLHKTLLVAPKEELTIEPMQFLDARGRDSEHGVRSRRPGQSPTRVRFEDESEKEAERRYLERVRERGPVPTEKSQAGSVLKPDPSLQSPAEPSKGHGSAWGQAGISTGTAREGPLSHAVLPQEEVVQKCDACGSILGILAAVDLHGQQLLSCTDPRGKPAPRWVSPGHNTRLRASGIGAFPFTGGLRLAECVGGAGERVSAFGKLRRRSRKVESRTEAGHVPYARSQDLWAQRRNSYSKNKSSADERSPMQSQAAEVPPIGVTFALGSPTELSPSADPGPSNLRVSPTQQLPIKSALKSGPKMRPAGQRVVKLMPSPQYRLIHLDQSMEGSSHLLDLHAEDQLTIAPGAATTSTGLIPCIKPSSLRYATAKVTSDLPPQGIWDTSSKAVTAHLVCEDVLCRDPSTASAAVLQQDCRPALRCVGMSRAENLRAELLRSEHRKAELLWEDMPDGTRRAVTEREGKPKLSLRRFFSAMGLNSVGKLVKGNRSSSMEHLSSPSPRHTSPCPSPTHRRQPPLQRTPSLQSLHTESPLAQLRKVSSVQSLQSPKRRTERSTILGEVPYSLSPRSDTREFEKAMSLEDLSVTRGTRPQGRLVQAFSDGSLLVELSRPANGPFGFVISRGKGRPGSGVFVDKVGEGSAENIYTGLLGVGDEILEVNGEVVAGLPLDQVTRLMTRDNTASIRILPHRWIQS